MRSVNSVWSGDFCKQRKSSLVPERESLICVGLSFLISIFAITSYQVSVTAAPGEIGSIIETLEFDITQGSLPTIVHITGDIFAIAYQGPDNDGFIITVEISTDGSIDNTIIDSLEFDPFSAFFPEIIHVSGDIYAIAYQGPDDDGFIATVDINSDGTIDNNILDSFEYETVYSLKPKIVHVSGDIYALVYTGPDDDGFVLTVGINSDGSIDNAILDSFEFDPVNGYSPTIFPVFGDIYAIAYSGPATAGFVVTVDINSDGSIDNVILDILEYDSISSRFPSVVHVSGDIYAIAYERLHLGFFRGIVTTVNIYSDGSIGNAILDSLDFDSFRGVFPSIIHAFGDIYAISYQGIAEDGFLITVGIHSDGSIGDAILDSLEFDTIAAIYSSIVHLSGDLFAVAYQGPASDGFVFTIEIDLGASDLEATKSNDLGGDGLIGLPFTWTVTVTNTDDRDAQFSPGAIILQDDLPTSGFSYGMPTIENIVNITNPGNISCMIVSDTLICDALGPVMINRLSGSLDIVFSATASNDGTFDNPQAGGICTVDPFQIVVESDETNNDCSDTVTIVSPELSIVKTNNVDGVSPAGQIFSWTWTVSNTGTGDADFADGEIVFSDQLPPDATYLIDAAGSVFINASTTFLDCLIDANQLLTCSANGGPVSIGAGTGLFTVVFDVTPDFGGVALHNPFGDGMCMIDPDNIIIESDETNNSCNDSVFIQPTFDKLAQPATVDISASYSVPFWCGQKQTSWVIKGSIFEGLEVFETEIEVIFPQKRILLIFPGPQQTAQIVESLTLTEPSNFQTPGFMSVPFRTTLDSAKTFRLSCDNFLAFPMSLDANGDLLTFLRDELEGVDLFHGALTLESDNQNVQVFVTKRVKSWVVDSGGNQQFIPERSSEERKRIEPVRVTIRKPINFEVPQNPFNLSLGTSSSNHTTRTSQSLHVKPLSVAGGREILFTAQGVHTSSVQIDI